MADDIGDAGDHYADSRWDRFKGWVSDNAGVLKTIAEIAAWVATGLAIIALLITSPVWAPIVGAIALAAGIVALVVHSALAASGEGSWTDVALDVFAIATFGIGRVAIKGVRAAVQTTRASAITAVRTPAVAARLADSATTLRVTSWALRTRLPLGPLRGVAMGTTQGIARGASRAGDDAVARMAGLTMPRVSAFQALRAFDRELAGSLAQLAHLGAYAPAQAAAAAVRAERLVKLLLVGAGVDGLDKSTTAAPWVGLPDIRPDLRWEVPTVDLPGLPLPSINAPRFALPGSR